MKSFRKTNLRYETGIDHEGIFPKRDLQAAVHPESSRALEYQLVALSLRNLPAFFNLIFSSSSFFIQKYFLWH